MASFQKSKATDPDLLSRFARERNEVAPNEAIAYAKSIPITPDFQRALFNFTMFTAQFDQGRGTLQLNLFQVLWFTGASSFS